MPRHGGKREGAGRKPGVPNKLTADLKSMILGALEDAGGREYLARQAMLSPGAFLTLVGKVLPLQIAGDPEHPVQFVIRGPTPVESTAEWLKLHAPPEIVVDADADA